MSNMDPSQKLFILVLLIGAAILTTGFFSSASVVGVLWGWENVTYDERVFYNALHYWKYYIDNYKLLKWDTSDFFVVRLFAATFIPILVILFLIFIFRAPLLDFRPMEKKESIHGDARWASQADIRKAGLRSKEGMLLGVDRRGYFIAGGYQHTLLFAPTGSGKGVGFVIPNLLFWNDSVVVHDIKLENYELTSGYRQKKMKQNVYLWNAASPDGLSHCYNPLDWVSPKLGQQVDDVQKIANLLLPEQEFWQNEARSLCVGVMLYLLAVPDKPTTFGEVVRTLRSDDVVYNLAVVLDTIGNLIHPVAYMNIAAFLQKADKERSGVVSTLNSSLELWANPLIDATTAKSDFNFNMIKKQKTTIYVGLTPDNIDRLKPLMQIFYQQATQFLCKHMPRPDEPYGVMFMMDEFPTLGDMEQFRTGIAYFRGYKVRLFLIIQDTEQLKGIYEDSGMNSFLSNATYRVTFSANNIDTAELISKMVGNKTVKQHSLNKPKFLDLNPGSRSVHESETQRALLLPQEVMNLPRDQQILLIESSPPIKSKKIFYYKDSFFTRRLLPQTFVPTQEPYDPRKDDNSDAEAAAEASENSQVEDPNSVPDNIGDYTGDGEQLPPPVPSFDDIDHSYEPDVPVEIAADRGFGEFKIDGVGNNSSTEDSDSGYYDYEDDNSESFDEYMDEYYDNQDNDESSLDYSESFEEEPQISNESQFAETTEEGDTSGSSTSYYEEDSSLDYSESFEEEPQISNESQFAETIEESDTSGSSTSYYEEDSSLDYSESFEEEPQISNESQFAETTEEGDTSGSSTSYYEEDSSLDYSENFEEDDIDADSESSLEENVNTMNNITYNESNNYEDSDGEFEPESSLEELYYEDLEDEGDKK